MRSVCNGVRAHEGRRVARRSNQTPFLKSVARFLVGIWHCRGTLTSTWHFREPSEGDATLRDINQAVMGGYAFSPHAGGLATIQREVDRPLVTDLVGDPRTATDGISSPLHRMPESVKGGEANNKKHGKLGGLL